MTSGSPVPYPYSKRVCLFDDNGLLDAAFDSVFIGSYIVWVDVVTRSTVVIENGISFKVL